MAVFVPHRIVIGEGWHLTLDEEPPQPAPCQLVTVLEGRGRWEGRAGVRDLEAQVPWWSSAGDDQVWSASGPARWLCLAGDRCPVAEGHWAPQSSGLPRICAATAADVRELASIVTDCPYPCELKDLLTRGKSLMLVSKTLAALANPEPEDRSSVRFLADDLDRVREARRRLLDRMEEPPTVAELAREVGLGEVKLKVGFRKLWGTTVYGLLRKERLEEARRFLEAGRGNVGEAAFRVGYTNTSHFAEAFQKEFGVSPGAFLRSRT